MIEFVGGDLGWRREIRGELVLGLRDFGIEAFLTILIVFMKGRNDKARAIFCRQQMIFMNILYIFCLE